VSRLQLFTYTDEDSWKIARLQGIGSSEIASILGKSPWSSRDELFKMKIGMKTKEFDSKARARLQCGRDMEAGIAERIKLELQDRVIGRLWDPGSYTIQARQESHFGVPFWLTCTIDRLVFPPSKTYLSPEGDASVYQSAEIVEIKTSGRHWDSLPENYAIQVQHQLCVTGCPRAHVVSMTLPQREKDKWPDLCTADKLALFAQGRLFHYVVERDEELHQTILDEGGRFCREVQEHTKVPFPTTLLPR
jgi:predicted phage-related endonuclease